MVVAVGDFNMAAMENKGLNIFNAKYVLARPETATDDDYEDIEGVIAHEYFHNWTGNRVTCRDWFQLTLKEGLTVFRDEQFTADTTSRAVKRIQDVTMLRTAQFAEDQSPTAHPIRPESYIEMNNFYTVTVYNKGAEVVRMMHTLLGADGFRRGMDTYFARHDGQAVTCDDFRAAMASGSGVDLEQFGRWYAQAGTPVLVAESRHDPQTRTLALTLRQQAPAAVDAAGWQPLHVPVAIGLLGADGRDLPLAPRDTDVRVRGTTALLELREPEHTWTFEGVAAPPVVSLLRDFSAPVKLQVERSDAELAFLMAHDADPVSRWDAAQQLADAAIGRAVRTPGLTRVLDDGFVAAFGDILRDDDLDGSIKALMLTLPDERVLGQAMDPIDVDGIHAARRRAMVELATQHADALRRAYEQHHPRGAYSIERAAIDGRRIANLALRYLVVGGVAGGVELALAQARTTDNMTDAQAALACLVDVEGDVREAPLGEFHAKWKHDPLVLDKWFALQAISSRADTIDRVLALVGHPDFGRTNPNRVRALLGSFSARNQVRFHGADGRGYALLADEILAIDATNPQLAARLVAAFAQWRRFDEGRREHMRSALARIVAHPKLSRDVYELASKNLGLPS
jgi:aminopeptidase N